MFRKVVMVALAIGATGGPVLFLEWPSLQSRLLGEYQNKIRKYSPPEKVFETFATKTDKGRLYMSLKDLLMALTPYNYCEEGPALPEDQLAGRFKHLLMLADINRDGDVSIYEYYNLLIFLGASQQTINNYFESAGPVDRTVFSNFLKTLRKESSMRLSESNLLQSRKVSINEANYNKVLEATADLLFKSGYDQHNILQLRREIFKQLLTFEFLSFPKDQSGKINCQELAKSLLCYMDAQQLDHTYKALSATEFPITSFSQEQYVNFHYFLEEAMTQFRSLAHSKGYLTKEELLKMAGKKQMRLNTGAVDVLFQVFDRSGNNILDKDEVLGVLQQRMARRTAEQSNFPGRLMLKQLEHLKRKCLRVWDVLKQ